MMNAEIRAWHTLQILRLKSIESISGLHYRDAPRQVETFEKYLRSYFVLEIVCVQIAWKIFVVMILSKGPKGFFSEESCN